MASTRADHTTLARLCALLPTIDTLAELKVVMCLLDAGAQGGAEGALLDRRALAERTGLSPGAVLHGLKRALDHHLICRHSAGRGVAYRAVPQNAQFALPCMHDMHENHDMHEMHDSQNMHDTSRPRSAARSRVPDNDPPTTPERLERILVQEFGVARRVAAHLVQTQDPEHVETHIAYGRHAKAAGLIRRNAAGWIVASIRDGWAAPKGYAVAAGVAPRWYTDEEYERFFFHPGGE